MPSVLANVRIPPIPPGVALADLELETRTRNCLIAAGFGRRPQDLSKMTAEEMLGLRGFWAKSLVDLLTSLEYAAKHPKSHRRRLANGRKSIRHGPRAECRLVPSRLNRAVLAEARAVAKIPEIRRIEFHDPRLGNMLRAMDAQSDSVGEMLDRIRRRWRLAPVDPAQLPAQWKALRRQLRAIGRLPLESELVDIFGVGEATRDRQIIARYFGWDGQGRRTLEALGREYGVSRERIRQICNRAIKRHRHIEVFAPILDRAIGFIAARTPGPLAVLQEEFNRSRISTCRLPIELVCRAARYLGHELPFAIVAVDKGWIVVGGEDARLPRAIAGAAYHAAASYGAATVQSVIAGLAARPRARGLRRLVRGTLETMAGFRWLDARRQWFQLADTPSGYGLPNMIGKILSVCPRIEVKRMHGALARNRRSRRPPPPAKVLLEFCRHIPGVRVKGTVVTAETRRHWRSTLTAVEQIMVQTLKRQGPILERAKLEGLCLRAGMNRFSFNAVLMSSPVIAQYGRGVYGLLA
jgi:Mor family transcriptional regulator